MRARGLGLDVDGSRRKSNRAMKCLVDELLLGRGWIEKRIHGLLELLICFLAILIVSVNTEVDRKVDDFTLNRFPPRVLG